MAENQAPQKQYNDEPQTGPGKSGYPGLGDDTPLAPAHEDEPVTGPGKGPYDAEAE